MNRYGPSRWELKFRIVFSVFGLMLLAAAVAIRGVPSAPALFEVIGIAGAFFGGTAIWSAWQLRKKR